MKKTTWIFLGLLAPALSALAQPGSGFSIVERPEQRQVDILYAGHLLTAYCYYDSIRKPILFPVNTLNGITVTRGYPIAPQPGERSDHPHHTGVWLNYESVNGLDFWNNSTAIPVEKRNAYGTIRHQRLLQQQAGGNQALLTVSAKWTDPHQQTLLNEVSRFHFSVESGNFIIDRITTLTAVDSLVRFRDVKDGMFAIRVARELELPSPEKSSFVDDKGNVTTVHAASAAEVTGMYYSSNGLRGDSVWGTQATWVRLTGKKDGEQISIGLFDHPKNPGFPAYWHARGYGLFAINPLGRKVFSEGREEWNLTLAAGQSVTFRYRIVLHTGTPLSTADMNKLEQQFSRLY